MVKDPISNAYYVVLFLIVLGLLSLIGLCLGISIFVGAMIV